MEVNVVAFSFRLYADIKERTNETQLMSQSALKKSALVSENRKDTHEIS